MVHFFALARSDFSSLSGYSRSPYLSHEAEEIQTCSFNVVHIVIRRQRTGFWRRTSLPLPADAVT